MPSPAYTAWVYSGKPEPLREYTQKQILHGQCSHCGHMGEIVLVKRVVSKYFTNWDTYSNADKPAWCNVCIWTFNEPNNRSEAGLFTDGKMYTCYQIQSLKEFLKNPLDLESFAYAALKKSKHVLPYTKWGHVRIEDINLRWGTQETQWLASIERLNSLGFALGDIKKDESPSFVTIVKLTAEETREAYALWETLIPLRKFTQLFTFILSLNKNSTMEYKQTTLSSH
jgi:hypothetical protein